MKKLAEFISAHGERFSDIETNVFAFAWGKVIRRLEFLAIIEARYLVASAAYVENTEAGRKLTKPGTHPLTREQAMLHRAARPIVADLHLEIESYYLFAKIILDDVVRAFEHYFGPVRGLALDSHDDFSRRLPDYAAAKGLTVSKELLEAIADLRRRISDVRDQKITHEKSPRTMQGTSWSGSGGASIVLLRLYPREKDPEQFNSEQLPHLRQAIDSYLDLVVACVVVNETKSALRLDIK